MKFDLTVGPFIGDVARIPELSVLAEKLGYNAVWVTHDPLWDNSWVICGAVGRATEKIQVGPGIVNPYSSSVIEIAMGAVSLNNLTGGRAVLGLGAGSKRMLEQAGLSQDKPLEKLGTSITYLRKALHPATSNLRIKTKTAIPIFIGCQSPKMLEHIGSWGVGGLILLTPPSYGKEALKHVSKGAVRSGLEIEHDKMVASILCSLDRDEENAREEFASFITHILEYLSPTQLQTCNIGLEDVLHIKQEYRERGFESLPDKVFNLGCVGLEQCFKVFEMLKKSGYTRFKIGSPLGKDKNEAITLFAKHVMPYFQEKSR